MPSVDNILQLCTTSSVPTQRSMGGLLWFRRLRHGMIQVYWNLSNHFINLEIPWGVFSVVSIPSPVNSSPEIKRKHLLLNGSTSSSMISGSLFIIFMLSILHSPKTNSESPWKNGWNWNNYILFSFPLAGVGLISGEFAVSFRVSITVKCLSCPHPRSFLPRGHITHHNRPQHWGHYGIYRTPPPKHRPQKRGEMGPSKISIYRFAVFDPPPK